MSTLGSLPSKLVMLKIANIGRPYTAKVKAIENLGLWLEAGELHAAIQRAVSGLSQKEPIPPQDQILTKFPSLFVPWTQIEWIASA
jgi:hypothetical protein